MASIPVRAIAITIYSKYVSVSGLWLNHAVALNLYGFDFSVYSSERGGGGEWTV